MQAPTAICSSADGAQGRWWRFSGGQRQVVCEIALAIRNAPVHAAYYQFDPFFASEKDMKRWVELFSRIRPREILGYASTIALFARFLDQHGQKISGIKGVFTTAGKLYNPQRELIERVLGCKVFDCYGSSEVQNIAAECAAGKMRINADFVLLEQERVDDDGPRPFLVTSLQNFSMPFIRYRNEDCGYLSDEKCTCRNHFPLMRLEIGRTSDNFVFPGGRVVHGEFFTHLMYGSSGDRDVPISPDIPG